MAQELGVWKPKSRMVRNGEETPHPSRLEGLESVVSFPSGVRGVLELSKHVWTHITNFGQSCMDTV